MQNQRSMMPRSSFSRNISVHEQKKDRNIARCLSNVWGYYNTPSNMSDTFKLLTDRDEFNFERNSPFFCIYVYIENNNKFNSINRNYFGVLFRLCSRGSSSVKFKKNRFFFCIFLKDIVSKIHLWNLICELLKLTKLWLFRGRDDQCYRNIKL